MGIDQVTLDASQKFSPTKSSASLSIASASATSNYILDLYQQPQETYYWCGPATASEIIEAKTDDNYPQSSLTESLHCYDDEGTPWYDGTHPMVDTLNDKIGISGYSYYGTQVNASKIKDYVTTDIDLDYGVAGDAFEVVNGPHLAGHPNQNIFHWFAIDGYSDSGNSIHYADSVHNASSISWSKSVPAYSSINYQTLATIVDERGIVW